jgi:hypothetical protein
VTGPTDDMSAGLPSEDGGQDKVLDTSYVGELMSYYTKGYEDATEKWEEDVCDELALTFSYADLALLGVALLALLVPLGVLLARTERPRWRSPWS